MSVEKESNEKLNDILKKLEEIDDFDVFKVNDFFHLISEIKGTELFENNLSTIEEIILIILKKGNLEIVSELVQHFEGTIILVEKFFKISYILIEFKSKRNNYLYNNLDEYLDYISSSKIRTFHQLIDAIKYTELFKRDYSSLKLMIENLLNKCIEDHLNFEIVVYLLKETGLIGDFLIEILNFIKSIEDKCLGLVYFSKLIPTIKNTKILKKNYRIIYKIFQSFLFLINKTEKNDDFGLFKKVMVYINFLHIFNCIGKFEKNFTLINDIISNILEAIDSLDWGTINPPYISLYDIKTSSLDLYDKIGGLSAFLIEPCLELDDQILYMKPQRGKMNLKSKIVDLIITGILPLNIWIENIKFFSKEERNKIFTKQEEIIKNYFKDIEIFEDLSEYEILKLFEGTIDRDLIHKLKENTESYLEAKDWKANQDITYILTTLMKFLSDQNIIDYLFSKRLDLLDYVGYDYYYLNGDVDELNTDKVNIDFSLLLIRCLSEEDEKIRSKAVAIIKKLKERADYAIHFNRNIAYKDQIIEAISIAYNISYDFLKDFILNIVNHPKDCMNYFIGYYKEETEFNHIKYRSYWEVIKRIKKDLTDNIHRNFDSNTTLKDFLIRYPKIRESLLFLSNNVYFINFEEISNREELIENIESMLESKEFRFFLSAMLTSRNRS